MVFLRLYLVWVPNFGKDAIFSPDKGLITDILTMDYILIWDKFSKYKE